MDERTVKPRTPGKKGTPPGREGPRPARRTAAPPERAGLRRGGARLNHPRSLEVTGVLFLAQGLSRVGLGAYGMIRSGQVPGGFRLLGDSLVPPPSRGFLLGTISILVGLFFLWLALGILRRGPRAWVLGMSAESLVLAVSLVGYLRGQPDYLTMALGAAAVFYLNSREVRQALTPAEVPILEIEEKGTS